MASSRSKIFVTCRSEASSSGGGPAGGGSSLVLTHALWSGDDFTRALHDLAESLKEGSGQALVDFVRQDTKLKEFGESVSGTLTDIKTTDGADEKKLIATLCDFSGHPLGKLVFTLKTSDVSPPIQELELNLTLQNVGDDGSCQDLLTVLQFRKYLGRSLSLPGNMQLAPLKEEMIRKLLEDFSRLEQSLKDETDQAPHKKILLENLFGRATETSLRFRLEAALKEGDEIKLNAVLNDCHKIFANTFSQLQDVGTVKGYQLADKTHEIYGTLDENIEKLLQSSRRRQNKYQVWKVLRRKYKGQKSYFKSKNIGALVDSSWFKVSQASRDRFLALQILLKHGAQDANYSAHLKELRDHPLYRRLNLDERVKLVCDTGSSELALDLLKTGIFYKQRGFASTYLTKEHLMAVFNRFCHSPEVVVQLLGARIFGRRFRDLFTKNEIVEMVLRSRNVTVALELLRTGVFYKQRGFLSYSLTADDFVDLIVAFSATDKGLEFPDGGWVIYEIFKERDFGQELWDKLNGAQLKYLSDVCVSYKKEKKCAVIEKKRVANFIKRKGVLKSKAEQAKTIFIKCTAVNPVAREHEGTFKKYLTNALGDIAEAPSVIYPAYIENHYIPYTFIRRGSKEVGDLRYEIFDLRKKDFDGAFNSYIYVSLGQLSFKRDDTGEGIGDLQFVAPKTEIRLESEGSGGAYLAVERHGAIYKSAKKFELQTGGADFRLQRFVQREFSLTQAAGEQGIDYGPHGIVMDHKGLSLRQVLDDRNLMKSLGFEMRVRIMIAILLAVYRLHKKGLKHRDLKLENVMLDFTDSHPQNPVVSLIDYEMLLEGDTESYSYHYKVVTGTTPYTAPEVWKAKKELERKRAQGKRHRPTDLAIYAKIDEVAAAGVLARLFGTGPSVWRERACINPRSDCEDRVQFYSCKTHNPSHSYDFSKLFSDLVEDDGTQSDRDFVRQIIRFLGKKDTTDRITVREALTRLLKRFPDLHSRKDMPILVAGSTAGIIGELVEAGGGGGGSADASEPTVSTATTVDAVSVVAAGEPALGAAAAAAGVECRDSSPVFAALRRGRRAVRHGMDLRL